MPASEALRQRCEPMSSAAGTDCIIAMPHARPANVQAAGGAAPSAPATHRPVAASTAVPSWMRHVHQNNERAMPPRRAPWSSATNRLNPAGNPAVARIVVEPKTKAMKL